MTTQEAYEQGFYKARNECLLLLAKWFYTPPGSDARDCRLEMEQLKPQKIK
jgi:hypothetical protein